MSHKQYQEANDWVTCSCGMLFSGVRKFDKLEEHIQEKYTEAQKLEEGK